MRILEFTVGAAPVPVAQVMEGLDAAMPRLTVGCFVEMTIPSLYAYGCVQGCGCPPTIPPHIRSVSVLICQVRLLSVTAKQQPPYWYEYESVVLYIRQRIKKIHIPWKHTTFSYDATQQINLITVSSPLFSLCTTFVSTPLSFVFVSASRQQHSVNAAAQEEHGLVVG
jgi:hypothetical protein